MTWVENSEVTESEKTQWTGLGTIEVTGVGKRRERQP